MRFPVLVVLASALQACGAASQPDADREPPLRRLPVVRLDIDAIRNGDHYKYILPQDAGPMKFRAEALHRSDGSLEGTIKDEEGIPRAFTCYEKWCELCSSDPGGRRALTLHASYRGPPTEDRGIPYSLTVDISAHESSEGLLEELERYYYGIPFLHEWLLSELVKNEAPRYRTHRGHALTRIGKEYIFFYERRTQVDLCPSEVDAGWVSGAFLIRMCGGSAAKAQALGWARPLIEAYLARFPSDLSPETVLPDYKSWGRKDLAEWLPRVLDGDPNLGNYAAEISAIVPAWDAQAFLGEGREIEAFVSALEKASALPRPPEEDYEAVRAFDARLGNLKVGLYVLTGFWGQDWSAQDWRQWWRARRQMGRADLVRSGIDEMIETIKRTKYLERMLHFRNLIRLVERDFGWLAAKGNDWEEKSIAGLEQWWKENRATFRIHAYEKKPDRK